MAILPDGLEIRIRAGQKTYHGFRDNRDVCFIEVIEPGDQVGRPLKHEVQHSPTGFEWGYGGSGPSDTARSILADHLGFVPPAAVYQRFKFLVVSQLDRSEWKIVQGDIDLAVEGIRQELGIDCLRCGDYGFIDVSSGRTFCTCANGKNFGAEFQPGA